MENYELMHHGILGMKWRIRRYQNKDGTLTEEGKLRYGNTNLTRVRDKSEIKTLCKMGLVYEDGYLTRRGHRFEVTRRSKLSAEETEKELRELVKPWVGDRVGDEDKDAWMPSVIVQNEVSSFIYDTYYSDSTSSETLKKLQTEISDLKDKIPSSYKAPPLDEAEKKKIYKQINEKNDELASVILQDLGYKDTKKARAYIKPIAIHDHLYDHYKSFEDLEKWFAHSDSDPYALAHHGIKGQKWGVLRFRNADGSLTALGRMRYRVGGKRGAGETGNGAKASAEPGTGQNKGDTKSLKRTITNAHTLSDEELRQRVSRLDLEKRYSELVAEQKKRETGTVERLLKEAGTDFLKQSFSKLAAKTSSRLFDTKKERFEIDEYRNADLSKLDLDTLTKIKSWYETAQAAERRRRDYEQLHERD